LKIDFQVARRIRWVCASDVFGPVAHVIVIGVEIGMSDVEGRLENFWRSQPLRAGNYTLQRFWLGLLVILPALLLVPTLGLILPPLAGDSLPSADGGQVWQHWLNINRVSESALRFLCIQVPVACISYGIAAFMASFTRRRVLSLVSSIGAVLFCELFIDVRLTDSFFQHPRNFLAYFLATLTLTTSLGSLTAFSINFNWHSWFDRARSGRREWEMAPEQTLGAS